MNWMYYLKIMVGHKCPACCSVDSADLQSISHNIKNCESLGKESACMQKTFLLLKQTEWTNPRSAIIRGISHILRRVLTVHLCLMQTATLRCPHRCFASITKIAIHWQMFLWLSSTQLLHACAFMNVIYIVKRFFPSSPQAPCLHWVFKAYTGLYLYSSVGIYVEWICQLRGWLDGATFDMLNTGTTKEMHLSRTLEGALCNFFTGL